MRHGVTFHEATGENLSFAESLAAARKERGHTQAQAAKLVPVSRRTWARWESGDVTPSEAIQARALHALTARHEPPGPRRQAALQRSHHLYWEKHKGWFFRPTINVGKRVVGKRRKFRLYTNDLAKAMDGRRLVLATLKRLGLSVADRAQKATGKRGPREAVDLFPES